MAIKVKITGTPGVEISGNSALLSIPITAYDYSLGNEEWKRGETTLLVTVAQGASIDVIKTAIKTKVDEWKLSLGLLQSTEIKLQGLVGLEI